VLPLLIDERVPDGSARVAAGLPATAALGAVDGALDITAI